MRNLHRRALVLAALLGAATLLAACQPSAPPAAAEAAAAPTSTPTVGSETAPAAPTEVRVGRLVIGNARSRETPLAGGTAPGFLSIRNEGSTADRLLSARSPAVESVEIHEMSMDGGQMQMRALPDGLPIPAGASVDLAPGGLHLMLIGVQTALTAGDTVPVELRFAEAGTAAVTLAVQPRR